MKIAVIGIGAVGGYFGAKLAKAGYDVTFIGTERSVKALKENGLFIKSYKGDIKIKNPKAYHAFEAIKDTDVVLFCVKSYYTESIAKNLKERINDKAVIISLQNGIENENVLASVFGKERIIASAVYITAASKQPGVINHTGYGKIILGEMDKKITPRVEELQKMFLKADIPAGTSDNVLRELWKKLILNTAYNGFSTLIDNTLIDILKFPEAKIAFADVLKESQKIANAEGMEISDDDVNGIVEMLNQESFINFKASTLQDMEKGNPVEIDTLQGTIVRTAQKHELKAPLNNLIYSLIKLKYLGRKSD